MFKVSPVQIGMLAGVAAAGIAAVYIARRGVAGAASAVAEGATRVVVDAATGAVIGVGKAVGVPETNMDECSRAIAEGRTWDASFACPAGTFLKSLVGIKPQPPVNQTILDANDARARGLGEPGCSCETSAARAQVWIGLAALGFALYTHAQNRERHRG